MVEEEENYYVESVGGIDENILSTSFTHMPSTPFICHLHLY
jgi:hypothetical protein